MPINSNPGLIAVIAQANVGLGVLKSRNVFVGEGRGPASKRFVFFFFLLSHVHRQIGDNNRAEDCYKIASKLKPQVRLSR